MLCRTGNSPDRTPVDVDVDIRAVNGDSGSPIYAEDGTRGKLYGMLWGGTSDTQNLYIKYHKIHDALNLD